MAFSISYSGVTVFLDSTHISNIIVVIGSYNNCITCRSQLDDNATVIVCACFTMA